MKKYYVRPNNRTTQSFKFYMREWNALIKPLEKLTGLKVYGFNPDISLCKVIDKKIVTNSSIKLPIWFVKILLKK